MERERNVRNSLIFDMQIKGLRHTNTQIYSHVEMGSFKKNGMWIQKFSLAIKRYKYWDFCENPEKSPETYFQIYFENFHNLIKLLYEIH